MPALIAFGTFVAVTLMVYGLLYKGVASDPMESRLGGLRYTRPGRENLPDPEAAFTVRVLRPMLQALTRRANSVLPSTVSE
ncbi:MAG: hypothetical protein M0R74_04465, partial [Dehalococcoidia bacterium]|nr:hypothetical protein [Dehalococcoidia bacterium]